MRYESLTGRQKVAIFLVAMGSEIATKLYSEMEESEIEQLSLEIASLDVITPEIQDKVLEEFYEIVLAQKYVVQGGLSYAKRVLEESVGKEKAQRILDKIEKSLHKSGFELLKNVDTNQLLTFLQNEQPQTISLILAHLNPDQSSQIISALPPEVQADVVKRIAILEQTSPEVIQQVEAVLETQIATVFSQEYMEAGGVQAVAEILNRVDRNTERNILSTLERDDPELAFEIKNLMFVFDDIVLLDDRSVQQVLKEVDQKELSIALKSTTDEVRDKVFKNMSDRAATMIKEEMQYMGPVRLRDVEENQQRIVNVIRRLEEEGTIIIAGRGGQEDQLVE